MKIMLLYGAGGHAKVIAHCMKLQKIELTAVIDDNPEIHDFQGICVGHKYDPDDLKEQKMILAIGNNRIRQSKADLVKHLFGKIYHPSASIFDFESLGEGSVAFQNVVIQPGAEIGSHVILNTASIVEHDCRIESFVHLAPRATLCGGVFVGKGTLIGAGAVVLPGIRIGKWCTIGAGSVVTHHVPDNCTVAGIPAK